MKAAIPFCLFLLAGCAEPPAPLAPPASEIAISHDHLSTDAQELGGAWVSVSLQRGSGKQPIVALSIATAFDPGVKSDAVSAQLLSYGKPLALSAGPRGDFLPVAGNFAKGGGTAFADFTFANSHSAPLTEIEVSFNGETKRFSVASLKRFPEDFQRG
jgi:hypothetical protein